MKRQLIILSIISILGFLISGLVFAQDPLSVSTVTPQQITEGQSANLSVQGTGFEATSIVRINGQVVATSFMNAGELSVTLPNNLTAGAYTIEVDNGSGNLVTMPNAFTIFAQPSIVVSGSEPRTINQGSDGTLSVFGENFTASTLVRLVGLGLLPTTFVNSSALTAQIPASLNAGVYTVEVIDGSLSFASPNSLRVIAPASPTQAPLPSPTPQTINTQPLLVLSSFTVEPGTIDAGQTVRISFTVSNRGNAPARAITVTLASSGAFVPAAGQASVTLPDLGAGASATGQMVISSSLEIAEGPVVIPLAMSYQDFAGESHSATGELSVTVRPKATSSQILVDAYVIEPSPAEVGQMVRLRLTLLNLGDTLASQVILRVSGDSNVLLPDGRGDSIPVGDIAARERIPVELMMLVNNAAENGIQVQPITIRYVQNGETIETTSNITVNVAASTRPLPLMLLAAYDTGVDSLQPGSRFTLNISLQNAGTADAVNTLVTFGTVQTSSGGEGGNGGNGGSSTTPSTTFAPLGTAGLVFVGDILSAERAELSQDFIVSGSVTSGIYPLPITLQYTLPDGTSKQDTLNISLVVIVPPRLQINPPEPLPSSLNVGEPMPLSLEIKNNGREVNFVNAVVTANNAEILDGATIPMEVLKVGDDTSIMALVMPSQDGEVQVTVTLNYMDELNQAQSIVLTYISQATTPEIIEEPPYEEPPVIITPEPEVNWFGRFMMAFFGLGS